MDLHHRTQLTGEASLNKAIAIMRQYPVWPDSLSERSIRSAWSCRKSVAPLCAAYALVFNEALCTPSGEVEERHKIEERQKIAYGEDLHLTLALAAAYERFGSSFTPHGDGPPLLDPNKIWQLRGVEADATFVPPPLPSEMLAVALEYAERRVSLRLTTAKILCSSFQLQGRHRKSLAFREHPLRCTDAGYHMQPVTQARVCRPQSEHDFPATPAEDHVPDRKLASSVSQFSLLSRKDNRNPPAEGRFSHGKLAYSVLEFGKASNLSRSLPYEAIKLGELQSIKVRGRRLILAEDGQAWLRSFRGGSDEQ
jgi:hypothetical protein